MAEASKAKNDVNIEEDDSAYQLISFVGFKDKDGRKIVDVVLSSWIRFDFKTKKYVCKFPPPPYDKSCRRNLNKLLKSFSEPLEVWPEYQIDFQGHAKTFAEGQTRLKKLNKLEFAYTTDDNAEKKIETTKRTIRNRKITVEPEVEKAVFNVPAIKVPTTSKNKKRDFSELQDSDNSIDELEIKPTAEKKKRFPKRKQHTSKKHSSADSSECSESSVSDIEVSPKLQSRKRGSNTLQNSETSEDDLEIKPSSVKKTRFIKPEQPIPTEHTSWDSEGSESSVSKRNSFEDIQQLEDIDDLLEELRFSSNNGVQERLFVPERHVHEVVMQDDETTTNKNLTNSESSEGSGLPFLKETVEKPITTKSRFKKSNQNLQPDGPEPRSSKRKGKDDVQEQNSVPKKSKFIPRNTTKLDDNQHDYIFNPVPSAKEKEDSSLLLMRILKCLHVMHLSLLSLQRQITAVEMKVDSSNRVSEIAENISEKYQLSLPLQTIEELDTIEYNLETNFVFKADFKLTLFNLLDRDHILTRTLTNISKYYLSRNVVMHFNATQPSEKRPNVFKKTQFYKCVYDFITGYYSQKKIHITEKEFIKKIGSVITNAIDWDGFRSLRVKKANASEVNSSLEE